MTVDTVPDAARRRSPPRRRGRPRLEDAEAEALGAVETLLADGIPVRDLTMEQVAARAGISKVTLYRRWPSRTALLAEVMMRRVAARAPLDETLPPAAATADYMRSITRELAGPTGSFVRAVVGECLADPAAATVLRDRWLDARRASAIRIIARGLEDGSFTVRGVAPERLQDMLYGAIWYRFLFGVGTFDAQEALALMEAVLRPAKAASRRPPRRPAPG